MKEDMRGLFFIVKGQYKKAEPSFNNDITGEKVFIGGYNPSDENTSEWYMALDKKTFHCVSCGSSLKKVLKGVSNVIKTYKGDARKYFNHVCKVTSEDYYETTYLGHAPLTPEQLSKKSVGRCPRVSPTMRCLYEKVFEEYGDYYEEEVLEMENSAYGTLKDNTPFKKSKKLMARNKSAVKEVEMEKESVSDTKKGSGKLKKINTNKRKGIKKLHMA